MKKSDLETELYSQIIEIQALWKNLWDLLPDIKESQIHTKEKQATLKRISMLTEEVVFKLK